MWNDLEEMYGVAVSPTLISNVTEAVLEQVRAWQSRPLDPLYPIVYLDALMVKMCDNGVVQNRAVYVALGVTREGRKEVLGLWSSANEGAKFWLQVLTKLKNRGLQDIFIACVDGLKGFPQAIETTYPQTTVQLCIVHLVRGSLQYVNWKERRTVDDTLFAHPTVLHNRRREDPHRAQCIRQPELHHVRPGRDRHCR